MRLLGTFINRGFGYYWVRCLIVGAAYILLLSTSAFATKAIPTLNHINVETQGHDTKIIFSFDRLPKQFGMRDHPDGLIDLSFFGKRGPLVRRDYGEKQSLSIQEMQVRQLQKKIQILIQRNPNTTSISIKKSPPNQVVLKIHDEQSNLKKERQIIPGAIHQTWSQTTNKGPVEINVLKINPQANGIQIFPSMADEHLGSRKRILEISTREKAIAGINGSFFKPDQGISIGILMINGEFISGPIYKRAALGMTWNGKLKIDRVSFKGELQVNGIPMVSIDNLNQPSLDDHQVVLYTPRWGIKTPPSRKGGMQIQIKGNRVSQVSYGDSLFIPKNGMVLCGPPKKSLLTLAQYARKGQPIAMSLYMYTTPDWSMMKHAIGGGPLLVKEGKIYIDTVTEHFRSIKPKHHEPRSAVGITSNDELILVTVDGRQKKSVGMTLKELAGLMKTLGAKEAMNLDGGSSTQMVVQGNVVNSPTAWLGKPVTNGVLVQYKP